MFALTFIHTVSSAAGWHSTADLTLAADHSSAHRQLSHAEVQLPGTSLNSGLHSVPAYGGQGGSKSCDGTSMLACSGTTIFTGAPCCCLQVFTWVGMNVLSWMGFFTPKKIPTGKLIPIALGYVGYIVLCNVSLNINSVGFYQVGLGLDVINGKHVI